MKFYSQVILLVIINILVISCSSDNIDYDADYEISKESWLDFKKLTSDSYKYTVQSSTWTGQSWETTLTIKDGEVSERYFQYTSPDVTLESIPDEDRKWTEDFENLNSHENSPAAEILTIDEVYLKAQQDWLIDRDNSETYFETENDGLISVCGYQLDDCRDDCFRGIKIKSITAL
jgi:hypothetical protein